MSGYRQPQIRGRPRPMLPPLEVRSPTGVRDSLDPSADFTRKLYYALNLHPQDAEVGGGLRGRPGHTALPSVGAVKVQGIYQAQRGATKVTLVFAGGLMYSLNWGTNALVNIPLGAGIVIAPTAPRVYAVVFNGKVLVHDGVTQPWSWDGNTFAKLTNAPVFFGPLVIHAAKVFGIKAAERTAIAWSEEGQENVGYEATIGADTFDNVWSLTQTDPGQLFALAADNSFLYYFRARSSGAVSGSTEEEFRSSVTREAFPGIGTTSPDSIVVAEDGSIWLLDADGHPQRLRAGAGYDPGLWQDARETLRDLPLAQLPLASGVEWPELGLILFNVATAGSIRPNMTVVYDSRRAEFVGVWSGYEAASMELAQDGTGRPTLVHGDDTGKVYVWGRPGGAVWTDAGRAIRHIAIGAPQGHEVAVEKHFFRLDLSLYLASPLTDLKISHTTPKASSPAVAFSAEGSFPRFGVAIFNVDRFAPVALERHVQIGLNARGRWLRLQVSHAGLGEQFGIAGWELTARAEGPLPRTP